MLERFNSLGLLFKTLIIGGIPSAVVASLSNIREAVQTFVFVVTALGLAAFGLYKGGRAAKSDADAYDERMKAKARRDIESDARAELVSKVDALSKKSDDLAEKGEARDAKLEELKQVVQNAGSTDTLPTKIAIDVTTHCEPPK